MVTQTGIGYPCIYKVQLFRIFQVVTVDIVEKEGLSLPVEEDLEIVGEPSVPRKPMAVE